MTTDDAGPELRGKYITTAELAKRLGVTVETVKRWRQNNYGPPYLVINKRVFRYLTKDVDAWEAKRKRTGG